MVGGVPCNNTTAGTWYARQRKTSEMKNLNNSFFNISTEVVIDIRLSSHFRRFSCCVDLSYFTFCIYGTGWHIHHSFLIPYLKPEFSILRICNSGAQKYKKKDKNNITNVAQQSDNTVVETWYGRRQESKAKTLLGSPLKIELQLDFLLVYVI